VGKTSIEWTDVSWPIVNGCRRASPGCQACYAERLASTRLSKTKKYGGLAVFKDGHGPQWTGEARLWEPHLDMPLKLRKPSKIFVADMGDLFYEGVPDEVIDRVMAVMLLTPRHTFQVLTKRAKRMREYMATPGLYDRVLEAANRLRHDRPELTQVGISNPSTFPASWIWFGVSVEDQKRAGERIPDLLHTPAAVRFVSYEPAIEQVDFAPALGAHGYVHTSSLKVDWIIVGGESGPSARPFDPRWALSTIAQCEAAGVACFVKQLGSRPGVHLHTELGRGMHVDDGIERFIVRDPKGGDWSEWPEHLRVREWPR